MAVRHSLAICAALLGSISAGPAGAQAESKDRYDLKPLIPPVFQLPPNSMVAPGAPDRTATPTDSRTQNFGTQPPPAPGMRITIPSLSRD